MKIINKIHENNSRKGFYLKYFFSFFIIFLIPLFLAFFIYNTAVKIIIKQCNNHVKTLLQQTRDITDSRLQEVKSITFTLSKSEYIADFKQEWSQPESDGDIFTAYKISHSIPKYEVVNSAVENIRLFFGKPSCCFVLGTDNAVRYTQDLEKLYWDETDIDYASLNQYLLSNHFYEQFMTISTGAPFTQNIYFLSNMNMFYQPDYSSVIVIKLSDQFFSDMLQTITLDDCGTAFILTEENDVVAYYQGKDSFQLTENNLAEVVEFGKQDTDGCFLYKNNQVTIIHSDFNGWTYYSLIPQSVIIQDLIAMRQLIMIVTIIVLIIGIFSCCVLTKRNSKPLKNIIGALTSIYEDGYFDSTDHFKFLENAVSALVERNSTYQLMLDNDILHKLFLGEYPFSAETGVKLSQSSISLGENLFITIYLHIHNLRETENVSQVLIDHLKENFYGEIYYLRIDKSNMLILAVHKEELADSVFPLYLKESLSKLGADILQETNCHIDFFLSEPMRHYENVHKSYEQCKRIARNVYKKSDLFVYSLEDLPPFQQIYHYTIDQEINLIQLIQYGNSEKLKEFLNQIYKENFEVLILSEGMKQDLTNAIQKSLQRNLSRFQSDERISSLLEFSHENTFEELCTALFALKEAVQEYISSSAKADSNKLGQNIIEYMQKNYGNPNLNLYYMCKELKISEQAASGFFQEFGSSFSTFLEKIRIENACIMLSGKNLTIKVISEKTGYSSDVSFRRAFKRILGISPSEFCRNNYAVPKE